MQPDLRKAIDTVDKLFKERSQPEWWADNIIEAGKHVKSANSWTKFYAYLSNPGKFDPDVEMETIGDSLDNMELEPLPAQLEEIRVQNGVETFIHVRNMQVDTIEECDEKVPQ